MPGRGRAGRPRRRVVARNGCKVAARDGNNGEQAPEPAVEGPPAKRLRARGNTDAGNAGDAGENVHVIDFEEIIRTAGVLPRGHNVVDGDACPNIDICSPTVTNFVGNGQTQCTAGPSVPQINVDNFMSIPNLSRQTNDDVSIHVPASLKQRICRGEYINLALLLKGAVELADYANGSSVFVLNGGALESRPRECKDEITSIERWSDAFIIFMDIYLSAQPHKMHEMLHYFYTIRECASNYGGSFWRQYDQQFRSRQAVMPSSWSALNQDLWLRCMSFRDSVSSQGQRNHNICLDFNKRSCHFGARCKYEHVCLNCGSTHPLFACPPNNRSQSGQSFSGCGQGHILSSPNNAGLQVSNFRGQPRGYPRSTPFHRPGRGGFRR